MFVRLLRVDGEEVPPQDFDRISAILATDQRRAIYEARIREELQPAEARVEYVNFVRGGSRGTWVTRKRIRSKSTKSEGDRSTTLIFATDDPAGMRS